MHPASPFVCALLCPTLAILSPVLGSRVGLPIGWQSLLFAFFIVLGAILSAKLGPTKNRPACQGRTNNDEPCKRAAGIGKRFCFQHQHGVWAKLASIPSNPTKAFWVNIAINILIALWTANPQKPVIAAPLHPPANLSATVRP